MRITNNLPLMLASALSLVACAKPTPPDLDDPLLGLNDDELERFEEGEEIFEGTFTAEQGLGPLFNAEGCAVCHSDPVDGGNGTIREIHATRIGAEGLCDVLLDLGGPVFQQQATQALTDALGITSEPIPAEASFQTLRSTPDVFGFGLLDAIPDETILALADPDDRNGDGISGRPNRMPDGRLGRFGRKAAISNLADFNEGAFLAELGLTTPRQLTENSVAGQPLPDGVDPAAEPEMAEKQVALTTDYVRFLAPPAPGKRGALEFEGQHLFTRIGCADCHVPSLRTGEHQVGPLSRQIVYAYTDLLLHDMGPGLADVCFGEALASEFRTEPLMGLRHVTNFLHDGRATTLSDAISAHDGEARAARDGFLSLTAHKREALLAFLQSL